MITFPTSQIQNPDLPRRPSIRNGDARANLPLRRRRRHRSSWLTADSRTCDGPSCAATSSANTLIDLGCPRAAPSCANLHSARRSQRHRLPFPAGSFIEGFQTPATVQAAALRSAGIRNPQHHRKSVDFSITSSVHSSLPKHLGSISKRPARFSSSHNMAPIAFLGA